VHQKTITYKIGIIADLDTNSKRNPKSSEFSSFLKKGFLTVSSSNTKFDFTWDDDEKEIKSGYALKGNMNKVCRHENRETK
jgi:Apyrase